MKVTVNADDLKTHNPVASAMQRADATGQWHASDTHCWRQGYLKWNGQEYEPAYRGSIYELPTWEAGVEFEIDVGAPSPAYPQFVGGPMDRRIHG